jgi:general secretion pathway protein H
MGGRAVRSDVRATTQAGLTLIELVVTLGVLAVAAAIVLPSIGRGTEWVRLRSEAGKVATLLRHARLLAVTQRRPVRVVLDRASNAVTLEAEGTAEPARELVMPAGLRLSVVAGAESLSFSPRGITRETRWAVEGAGQRRLVIEVEGISGRVTVGQGRGS